MKKTTVLLFAFLCSFMVTAQSKSDKIYDVFAGKEGVTNFTFSKSMIDAIDIDLGDDGEERQVTGDLHKIRFLSYNPRKGSLSGPQFIKKAVGMLPSQYKKYEEDGDDDSDAEIWLLGNRKKYSECHVFINNQDAHQNHFLVSFYGDFSVNSIKKLKKKGKEMSND